MTLVALLLVWPEGMGDGSAATAASGLKNQATSFVDPTFNAQLGDGYARIYATAVQPDGKILVGGTFTFVNGVRRLQLTRLNTDGSTDSSFNNEFSNTFQATTNGFVEAIALQPDGKILLGGSFPKSLARLNPDGSIDQTLQIGNGPNHTVNGVTLADGGNFYVSGLFQSYNGATANRIARVNADGSRDATFNPPAMNGGVDRSVVQADNKVVITGGFSAVGGVTRPGIARLNQDGSLDTTFVVSSTLNYRTGLAIQPDGKVLYSTMNQALVRLNTDGSRDNSFNVAFDPQYLFEAYDIEIQPNGRVLAGGLFGYGTDAYYGVARYNTDGTLDGSFARQIALFGEVNSVSLTSEGKVIAAGDQFKLGSLGTSSRRITKLNSDGTVDPSFTGKIGGDPRGRAVAIQPDGKIIAGGEFLTANGVFAHNIARFFPNGSIDTSFKGTSDKVVNTVVVDANGRTLLGTASGITRLKADGTIDETFTVSSQISQMDAQTIVLQPDGKMLIGGRSVLTSPALNSVGIIRLLPSGQLDQSFAMFENTLYVNEIELLPNGQMYVGGGFVNYGGTGNHRLAKLNVNGSVDTSFTPTDTINSSVFAVAQQADGKVLIGGAFDFISGKLWRMFGRLNADSTHDVSLGGGSMFTGWVQDMFLRQDGKIVMAGRFPTVNGTPRLGFAVLNADGTLDPTDAKLDVLVQKMAPQPDGKVVLAGWFTTADGQPHMGIARVNIGTPTAVKKTAFDFDNDGKSDVGVYQAGSGNWLVNRSQDGFLGQQFGGSGDILAPADYDGDARTDLAIYRPATGVFFISRSTDGGDGSAYWGLPEDVPAPGDFDGDGRADIAVFRPSTATFWIRQSGSGNAPLAVQYGVSGDQPVVGDYDGDGKADVAVYRSSTGIWYIHRSSGGDIATQFGTPSDKVVPADYDGDGKTDVAVYRTQTGVWFITNSSGGYTSYQFGYPTDIPTPGDYDGDGKTDMSIFRPAEGNFWINGTKNGVAVIGWGKNGDVPVENAYVR